MAVIPRVDGVWLLLVTWGTVCKPPTPSCLFGGLGWSWHFSQHLSPQRPQRLIGSPELPQDLPRDTSHANWPCYAMLRYGISSIGGQFAGRMIRQAELMFETGDKPTEPPRL